MKTKTFLSDLTPPRHTGLFAKLKGLRFMLVMILATLGVNVAFGAEIFTFSWTTAGTQGYSYKQAGPTSGTLLTNNAVYFASSESSAPKVDAGKLNPYRVGFVFKPAYDVTMKIKGSAGSSARSINISVDDLLDSRLFDLYVNAVDQSKTLMQYALDNASADEKTFWISAGVLKNATTVSDAKAVVGYTANANQYSSRKSATALSIAKNGEAEADVTVDDASFVFKAGKCYRVYLAASSSTGSQLVSFTFTQVISGPVDPTSTFSDANYEIGETLDLASKFTSNSTGAVTYTVKDAGTTGASISGSNFTATAAGTAIVTASQAAVADKYNAKTLDATITVTAAVAKYAVNFAAGDGTGTMDALEYAEGAEVTLPACTFTAPAGKEFDAWTTTDVTITDGKFTMPANAVTITATWKDKATDYVLVGATPTTDTETLEQQYKMKSYTSGDFSMGGGMNVTEGKTDGRYVGFTIPAGCTAKVDIAGKGSSPRVLALVTEADRASGTWTNAFASATMTGTSNVVTASTTTNLNPGTYAVGSTGSGLTITSVIVHLYGTPVVVPTHHVTYAKGDATCEITLPTQADVKENKTFIVANAIACDGYNFLGWNDGSANYAPEATYTMGTADVVLTAQWEEITTSWTVTYNANGGTCGTASATWTGGDALVLPAAEKTDMLFDGWYDSEDNLIGKAGAEYTPTDNIELFAHYSYENKLKKAVFSNGFDAFINEDAKSVSVYYLDGSAEPTLTTGTASLAVCTVSETEGKLVVTAPDDSFVEYTLTKTAVTPAAVGEYTFDGSEDWVKAPYGFDVENNRGWKYSKNADDGRVEKGNNRQYYFVAACEKLVLHTASGITSDRNIFVYVNNVKVDAITKAPKYNDAGSYIEIPCNGSAAMVAIVSNQTGGDGGFGKADVVAHEVSNDATLSTLSVADNTIAPAFAAATYNYTCELPYGTAAVPAVSYTLADANATAVKTDAASVTGTTSIVVTAEDGSTQLTYTIQFSVGAAPAATPTIDTDLSATASFVEGGSVTLSVAASTTDAGTLSYQWYKGEALVGENAPSLVVNAEGSYKVVVTNALSESNKATATSTICVVTETEAAGCNTISSIPAEAPYQYEQTDEWTIYGIDSNGADKTSTTNYFVSNAKDFKGVAVNAYNGQHIAIKFDVNVEQVKLYGTNGNTGRGVQTVKCSNSLTKNTYTDITSECVINITRSDEKQNSVYNYVSTIDGIFEAGKYYWFNLGGSMHTFKVCYTEATVDHVEKGLTSVLVNEVAIADDKLATLNSSKALTLEAEASAPTVKMTYATTTYFTNGKTIVVANEETAVNTSDATNYYATATFETVDYVITFPIDRTPEMNLTAIEGSIALSGHTRSGNQTTTLSGANLTDGTYSVSVPEVEGLSVSPTSFTVADGAVNETFTITYASEADVVESVASIVFSDGTTSKTFALTYSSAAYVAPTYTAVSASRTWDWKQASSTTGEMKDSTSPARDTEFLLSDVVETSEDFHSENLKMAGQYAVRKDGSKYYFQGNSLKLTTTIEGVLEVYFSNTASKSVARNLFVNGKTTGIGDKTGSENAAKAIAVVQPGEIELNAYLADGSSEDKQYVRIYKVVFTALDEYAFDATIRSGLTNGKLVTMCQAQSIEAMDGAVPFEVAEATAIGIDLVEATFPLVAGKPYILEANKADVRVVYGTDEATEVVPANGLIGNLSSATEDIVIPTWTVEEQYYIFLNNHICKTSTGNYITPDRAYLRKDLVNAVAPAPGRRRISMTTDDVNTPTVLDALMQKADIQKVMIDGHVFIIREGKMFNAVGQMVK